MDKIRAAVVAEVKAFANTELPSRLNFNGVKVADVHVDGMSEVALVILNDPGIRMFKITISEQQV